MTLKAVVVAPGRGTYNKSELGYLTNYHANRKTVIQSFDGYRQSRDQDSISQLDGAARFSAAVHTRGDNASPLIFTCGYCDFLSIDRNKVEIVGVMGNSMGWYTALTCAGALDALGGLDVANTMGTLMHQHLIGGQLIYPFVDDNWQAIPERMDDILTTVSTINGLADHELSLSIDLGGLLVLAGNSQGLAAFETRMPAVQDRFPMRLQNHAGFHTQLQKPVAELGQRALSRDLFRQPDLPLIDGRGALWWPHSSDLDALWQYTLGHQVTEPYNFSAAIRVAARELMPDAFIVLGPGTTLGGAVGQSLVRANWRGWSGKEDFKHAQDTAPHLISMGMPEQRPTVC